LNKSGLDKTTPYQSFSQAIRTLSGMPARVTLFDLLPENSASLN